MQIKFFDALKQDEHLKEDIQEAINEVLHSNQFVDGPQTRQFEEEYAAYNGVKYCVTTSSGTTALELMFRALKLDNGKNILTTANSFLATASSIVAVGSNPIFCDTSDDFLLDLNKIEEHLKRGNIDAILAVNLYGNLLNLNKLQELGIKYGAKVLIDGAQNALAKFKGKSPASYCLAEAVSFYTTKSFGCYGEGGCVLTNDRDIYEAVKSLRNHGRSTDGYRHTKLGGNARIQEFQTAILRVKLKYANYYIEERQKILNQYNKNFYDFSEILTKWNDKDNLIVPYVFPIRVKRQKLLKEFLIQSDIPSIIHYSPIIPLQPCFKYLRCTEKDFPNAYQQSQEVLSLPFYANMPLADVDLVSQKTIEFLNI